MFLKFVMLLVFPQPPPYALFRAVGWSIGARYMFPTHPPPCPGLHYQRCHLQRDYRCHHPPSKIDVSPPPPSHYPIPTSPFYTRWAFATILLSSVPVETVLLSLLYVHAFRRRGEGELTIIFYMRFFGSFL